MGEIIKHRAKKKLVKRLVATITLSMTSVGLLLLAVSGWSNWVNNKNFYNEKSYDVASAVADGLSGDTLEDLVEIVKSDEFNAIPGSREGTASREEVAECLKAQNMDALFDLDIEVLSMIRNDMHVEYIYVQVIEDGTSITLLDPTDSYKALGYTEKLKGKFKDLEGNVAVKPTVSKTDLGWLSSAGVPILNNEGKPIAVAFCDINMTELRNKTIRFIAVNLASFVVIVLVLGLLLGIHAKKTIASPIEKLTEATDRFGQDEATYNKENIVNLDIHSGDEIEALYQSTRFMQESLIDYMENLTAVTAEKERIGAELDVATRIQASMLPSLFPAFPERHDFDIYASMDPAKEVGGDFYDFFLIDEDHLGMVIADVSGKGVPAALFMMMSKIIIANYAQMGLTPAEVLERTNNRVCEGNKEDMFVTVWFGILTISTGHVVAANAGHEYPMLRGATGEFTVYEDHHDFVIGGMEGMPYTQYEFDIEPGGTLFLYTDGCPEATDKNNELFGTDRMLAALNEHPDATPKELLAAMTSAVDRFVGEAPQFDDLTMLAIKLSK